MQDKEIKDYLAKIKRHRQAIVLGLVVYIIYIVFMLLELNRSLKFQSLLMAGFFVGMGIFFLIHFLNKVPALPETHFLGVSQWLPFSFRNVIETAKLFVFISLIAVTMHYLKENVEDQRMGLAVFIIFEMIITSTITVLFTKYQYKTSDLFKLLFYAIVCFVTFWFPLSINNLALAGMTIIIFFLIQGTIGIIINPIYYGLISDPYILEKQSGRIFGPLLSQNATVGKDVRIENGTEDEIAVRFDEAWKFTSYMEGKMKYSKVYTVVLNYGRGRVNVAFPRESKQWFEGLQK